jgi:hypothetical protein
VCFEFDDAAEGAGFDEFAEGDEVGVPAAVCSCVLELALSMIVVRELGPLLTLINGKMLVRLLRNRNQLFSFLVCGGKRLLADNCPLSA